MKDKKEVISEYFALISPINKDDEYNSDYTDSWDESDWSDEPKSGCWGDW